MLQWLLYLWLVNIFIVRLSISFRVAFYEGMRPSPGQWGRRHDQEEEGRGILMKFRVRDSRLQRRLRVKALPSSGHSKILSPLVHEARENCL
jgi:hypothetical protein